MLRQSVDDPAARILQHLGIVDVILLVKTGPQFQQAEHILSPVCRIGQGRGDLAAGGHAVERNLDGEHLRVICCLINQVHKGHHALEGEAHQQVVLFDIAEVLPFFESNLPRGLPLFVAEMLMGTDARAEREIKRHCRLEDALLRHMEFLDQHTSRRICQFAVDLRPHRGLPFALGEHGGGFFPEVLLSRHLGEEHIGIPGHLHHGRLENVLLLQQQRQETPHQLVREDDLLYPVDLEAEIRRDTVHRDDGEFLDCAPAKECHHIALLAPEERQCLIRIDDLREEQVLDVSEELLAHKLVDFADFIEIENFDSVALQLTADRFPDALHQAQLFSRDTQHFLDRFFRHHSRNGISLVRCQNGPVCQDADSYSIKLLQV